MAYGKIQTFQQFQGITACAVFLVFLFLPAGCEKKSRRRPRHLK